MDSATAYVIAGDIGGTNSRIRLFKAEDNAPVLVGVDYLNETYLEDYQSEAFPKILLLFMDACKDELAKMGIDFTNPTITACFACAGPVKNNKCEFSNNIFVVDGQAIQEAFKIHVILINDFVGQGYGCLTLDLDNEHECMELSEGSRSKINKYGPKVCIGAGTGLGECFLTNTSDVPDYTCFPSEGGHVEFAPFNQLEQELSQYLKDKFGSTDRISVERIVSGRGLADVYDFLAKKFPEEVDRTVDDEFRQKWVDQGVVVGSKAKDGNLCEKAVKIFARAYGTEAGNCALKWYPTGGLYVTGGIIEKMLKNPETQKHFEGEDSVFMQSYKNKGRLSYILNDVPLFAVKAKDIGVRGAQVIAVRMSKQACSRNNVTN